jgi:hypothetical protein
LANTTSQQRRFDLYRRCWSVPCPPLLVGKKLIEMDPYDVLGVDSNHSIEEIKVVYHKLAREYHPDKAERQQTTDDVTTKFLQIQEAWELIKASNSLPKLSVMSNTIKTSDLIKIDEDLYSFPCRCGESYEVSLLISSLTACDLCFSSNRFILKI